jgi:glycosyltransferase involved in cell wall biosynthesis
MKGKVSVVVPLYNKQNYIEQTLRSVMNQTYKNLECLIVDDGSTDNSVAIARKFIEDNQLSWSLYLQSNSGQTKARNHGIRESKGEYIAFLDSDDLWAPNKLELQVKAIEENHKSVLVLSAYAIFKEDHTVPRIVRHRKAKKMNSQWIDMRGFGGGLESLGLVRRDVLDKIGLFDEHLSTSSGLDLSLRLEKIGDITLLNEIGLYYRISIGQWHGKTDALKQDLRTLSEKYSQGDFRRTSKFQDAYFFWISTRLEGPMASLKAFLHALLVLDLHRLQMLKSLVLRNFYSRIYGWVERKKTISFLISMDIRR